ncbi:MAG: hypothetical protein ABIQ88_07035 [Chitinophagaceae bacterium]
MNIRLLIIISFGAALLSDAIYYLSTAMHISLDGTYFIGALKLVSLICLLVFSVRIKWKMKIPPLVRYFFKWMIVWNVITIIRGGIAAGNYWDWKYLFLNSSFTMLVPYALITGILFTYSKDLLTLMVTRLFVFGYIILPLTLNIDLQREFYPRAIMITICFFLLLVPYVKTKWQIAILGVAAASVLLAYDYRANVIRIILSLLLVMLYYVRNYISTGLLKFGCLICVLIPPVFLLLGVTGQYNIFKPSDDVDKYDIEYDNGVTSNLATDTRTFLYEEVFSSMRSNHSFIFGEGATAKYKTVYFDDEIGQNGGRYGAEVGFLNTLLYSGVIGVFLYALVLFSAIYYGMAASNNFFCKMLAIFLAFRWIVLFIEDFVQYDTSNYFLWFAVGLCLSKDFRAMTDADIREYFNFSPGARTSAQLS